VTLPRRQPLSTSDGSGHAVSGLSSVMLTVTLVGVPMLALGEKRPRKAATP